MSHSAPSHPAQLFINNQWIPSVSGETLQSIDPADESVFAEVASGGAEDIDAAVFAAREALGGPWARTEPAQRGRILMKTAELIRARAADLAAVETRDTG